jgi:hypothetical protein
MACIASTAGPERQGGNYLCPVQGRPYSTKADSNAARTSKRSQHLRLTADGIGNACHGATGSDGCCTRDIHFRSRQEDNYIFLMQNKKNDIPAGSEII